MQDKRGHRLQEGKMDGFPNSRILHRSSGPKLETEISEILLTQSLNDPGKARELGGVVFHRANIPDRRIK